MSNHLHPHEQRTIDQVFQHPISHNLEWRDIKAMFASLGDVEQEHNGNLKVVVSGHSLVFNSPKDNGVASADEVMEIRHFLQANEVRGKKEMGTDLLVVLDHHHASIFRTEMKGSVPETVVPHDPHGHTAQVHSSHDYQDHTETPDLSDYFEQIAGRLAGATKIVVFGTGKGSSSAKDLLVDWLAANKKELSAVVVGAFTVDETHMTEGQLLAKAREIYA